MRAICRVVGRHSAVGSPIGRLALRRTFVACAAVLAGPRSSCRGSTGRGWPPRGWRPSGVISLPAPPRAKSVRTWTLFCREFHAMAAAGSERGERSEHKRKALAEADRAGREASQVQRITELESVADRLRQRVIDVRLLSYSPLPLCLEPNAPAAGAPRGGGQTATYGVDGADASTPGTVSSGSFCQWGALAPPKAHPPCWPQCAWRGGGY